MTVMPRSEHIVIEGARQNTLKGISLKLPLHELIVVTGVSGSGKSSLAFDTIYSEGQRRYVETFSPYARQFLDRMDKPRADRIEGIPPAIAIDQTNPVRTSRSTVGTMTELNDHLKLLFARSSSLYCRACGRLVQRDTPGTIFNHLAQEWDNPAPCDIQISFSAPIPRNFSESEVRALLARQGYERVTRQNGALEVIHDRISLAARKRTRIAESLEAALKHGQGRVTVTRLGSNQEPAGIRRFSTDLHCAECDIHYQDPTPGLFSFNSPVGACDTCRGFGRTIGIDYGLVIPDDTKTLAGGAVKPWQTESYRECQDDLMSFARRRNIPANVPWRDLSPDHQKWVIEGEGPWEDKVWYGAKRFFEWLETKSYRMHIRVLLSKYRTYRTCPGCGGARLKPDAILWRLGPERLSIHDIVLLPIDRCLEFFQRLRLPASLDEATDLLFREIRARLGYLVEVGLGYLTLDRQSRTLSGGEVQRINLTTALGTSLVNTLFVLDEPSIGLHPRDIGRLIRILHKLRDAGNTLIVVEHDPDVIRAADRVLDMGPGPGESGGEIVYFGPLKGLMRCRRSLTGRYLAGEISGTRPTRVSGLPDSASGGQPALPLGSRGRSPSQGTQRASLDGRASVPASRIAAQSAAQRPSSPALHILGAAENNLKNIDVEIPLERLVCITGVSGSGKSTLVQNVLYYALRKLKHKPLEQPGRHRAIAGHEAIADVVMVDQSPIGRTTRSTPGSYTGAFDAIRAIFADTPLARERDYTAGTFSFNSGTGRCPTCGGNGFERVEMQFLSDVFIRCADCEGLRYRPEVLEIRFSGKSMADVLDMTVTQACAFFAEHADVLARLAPLRDVGLGYVKLGQPTPTLSGGEAQRLKLAGHLADSASNESGGPLLFLFDEPTTGLHFDDIATLLIALKKLVAAGHSIVVIEHNLDVIRAADWIIDLGPEGGEKGGEIICKGTPSQISACPGSYTGAALRTLFSPPPSTLHPSSITIHHAREHNLKNADLTIPRDRFTVITGVSGSGKSTVAFDILFAEGQRRYLESLNAYARQFVQPAARPDVDAIFGIPPTVAIEQRTSRGGRKSTVATVTEIYHFLRLLFVKLGVQNCPECRIPIRAQTPEQIHAQIMSRYLGRRVNLLSPLVASRKGYYTDLAVWAATRGFNRLRVDGRMVPTRPWPRMDRFKEHSIELPVGTVDVGPRSELTLRERLASALEFGKGVVYLAADPRGLRTDAVYSVKRACPRCNRSFPELDPRLFSYNSKHGWCPRCYGTGELLSGFDEDQTGEEIWWNEWWEGGERVCPDCEGRRLRPEALAVTFQDRSIAEFTALSVEDADRAFRGLRLRGRDAEIARDILPEVRSRLGFLMEVGLPYLSLDRGAPTLSGGEARRIRLAAQLGSNLRGVCYILDKPTIGLHARDNRMLIETLRRLKDKGNTVVVVEHDEDTIRQADHVIDLGPGAGLKGGHVVAAGTVKALMRNPRSVTGRFLDKPLLHPLAGTRRRVPARAAKEAAWLKIAGANLHNLRALDVSLPLGCLVCVSGVSGSGKSTLVRDILHANLARLLSGKRGTPRSRAFAGCRGITGHDRVARVLEVDQTPIGKTPRSCPATYVGFWDEIRRLFAATPDARMRGYGPSRFSFNVPGGRCEACEGQGVKRIEMSFLPDVAVPCDVCGGARFTPETLAITYAGKSIAQVLAMTMDDAAACFEPHPRIHHALRLLQDVGLGYLTLGQQSPTLSGGEAQRIKLVTELAKARPVGRRGFSAPHTLYVLDEPTIGLHMADVERLILVLHRLVDAGNTLVVIEHNLDVIAEADWVLDLGPEGGTAGGRIVAQGTPEHIARQTGSHTGQFLENVLTR